MTINLATHICVIEHWLQLGSAALAGLAAVTWFRASRAKMAPTVTYANVNDLPASMIKQSRLNAYAALFAAGSALLQFFLAFMPTCWSGSPWFIIN